jgi:hypothetical protein
MLSVRKNILACIAVFALFLLAPALRAVADETNWFQAGLESYRAGYLADAGTAFRNSLKQTVSAGVLQNLGNVEWHRERVGDAVLAWEQALWVDPFNAAARNNLQFAREAAQLESPELRWFEVASTWLPNSWWAWLTGLSLWTAVAAVVIPGVLRRRRSVWQQVVAAIGLGIFLLCVPAHVGTMTRAKIGFVLNPETRLRLTPTEGAETVTLLGAGEPVRSGHSRGKFIFVRTNRGSGWLDQEDVGLISQLR